MELNFGDEFVFADAAHMADSGNEITTVKEAIEYIGVVPDSVKLMTVRTAGTIMD